MRISDNKMTKEISIREAKSEDLREIWALCAQYFTDVIGSSFEEFTELWEHRWFGSPFKEKEIPLGWVLIDQNDKVKGFIGNISLMVRQGQSLVKAYAATTWVASPEARNNSLDLFRAFVRYDQNAYLLDTTANKVASLVCKRLGMSPVAVNGYQRRLIWIIDPLAFLGSKRALNFIMLKPVTFILGFILKAYLLTKRHWIVAEHNDYTFSPIDRFGPDYDRFWDGVKEVLGIVQEKSSAYMNWRHLSLPKLKGTSYAFACKDKTGTIVGILALKANGEREGGAGKLVITDVLYKPEHQAAFTFMLAEAFKFARQRQAEMLEFSGFNESLMDRLLVFHPFVRQHDHVTYWIKAPAELAAEKKYWVSGCDGDLNI